MPDNNNPPNGPDNHEDEKREQEQREEAWRRELDERKLPLSNGKGKGAGIPDAAEVFRLLELAKNFECFHHAGEPFVRFEEDDAYKTFPANKDTMAPLLSDWFEAAHHVHATQRAVESVCANIARRCVRRGVQRVVGYRSAALYEGEDPDKMTAICYDLGDSRWGAMKITHENPVYVERSPIPMRRYEGMLACPEPQCPVFGDERTIFDRLQEVAPLPDEDSQWIRLAFLLSAMWPAGPYPILKLLGPPVSGKTFHARVIRRIVDPIEAGIRGLDKDEECMLRVVKTEHLVVLDNLDLIPPWLSAVLCRLSTGASQKIRRMFTEAIAGYQLARPVVLTSLEDQLLRPDLMSRCLVINLPDPGNRVCWDGTEAMAKLDKELPYIMYALFELLSCVLESPKEPRQSDPVADGRLTTVNKIMAEVEHRLGFPPGTWARVLQRNRNDAFNSELRELPQYVELLKVLADQRAKAGYYYRDDPDACFQGTVSDLLNQLHSLALERHINTDDWPSNPSRFSRDLRDHQAAIQDFGVTLTWSRERTSRGISVGRTKYEPPQ